MNARFPSFIGSGLAKANPCVPGLSGPEPMETSMTVPAVFQFEETAIRTMLRDEEPWFVGRDVCTALQIKNSKDALSRLDSDERDGVGITDPMGRPQTATIISEPGVYRLVFTSRTERAEAFKRWLAHEVLPALRRNGVFAIDDVGVDDVSVWGLPLRKVDTASRLISTALRVYGPDAARRLWEKDKTLPNLRRYAIGKLADTPDDDPSGCLRHLLRMESGSGATVGMMLDLAMRDKASVPALKDHGIWVGPGSFPERVALADEHPFLRAAFSGTQWAGEWRRALILLDGATRTQKTMAFNGRQSKAVLVPRATILALRHGAAQ